MESLIFNCILCLIVISLFSTLCRLTSTVRKSKLPPGPKPFPIIGNLLDLGEKPHKSLANLAKIHGPIMSLKLGQVTTVVVSSAATIKEVLHTHDQFLSFRYIPDALTVFNHSELALPFIPISCQLWRNLRRICNNRLFSTKVLDANENLRRKKLEDLVDIVQRRAVNGEAVDIGVVIFMTTLNLVSNTVFSIDLADPNSEFAGEFKATVRGILEEAGRPNIGDLFPVLKKMDIQGIRKRITVHFRKILDLIDSLTNQRLESSDFTPKNDLLHHLLTTGEDGSDINLDNDEIKHLLLVLLIAGTDTTTATIQWSMAYLLKNPEVMSKAKEELRRVTGKGNPVEESHIEKLPFLQAIIKETLRLQSVFLLPRRADAEVTIAGFTIPKDAKILVNMWALGRDPEVWENPDLFLPERFLGSEIDVRGRSFEFIPFGGGRRICPGLPLAMRMLHLLLGSLIHWFDWKLEDGVTPKNLNMDDKFGITVEMAQPLRAVPVLP